MQFLVIGHDGTDEEAPARRQAVRQQHIELGDKLVADGNCWYGAALTDQDGIMVGSAFMMDFPSRDELDQWLAVEPYVTGNVWERVEILPCKTRDPWQFNRPKAFFEARSSED